LSADSREFKTIVAAHQQVIEAMLGQSAAIDSIAMTLVATLTAGGKILIIGNGGSASDAQHIAGELLGRFRAVRKPLPAIALVSDAATMTAVGNDFGYEHVFARQVEALLQPGDVLWALSTSGNSPNILAAAQVARRKGNTVIGFTGRTGGKLAELCTYILKVPHDESDRIQEGHVLAYHYICERVEAEAVD